MVITIIKLHGGDYVGILKHFTSVCVILRITVKSNVELCEQNVMKKIKKVISKD